MCENLLCANVANTQVDVYSPLHLKLESLCLWEQSYNNSSSNQGAVIYTVRKGNKSCMLSVGTAKTNNVLHFIWQPNVFLALWPLLLFHAGLLHKGLPTHCPFRRCERLDLVTPPVRCPPPPSYSTWALTDPGNQLIASLRLLASACAMQELRSPGLLFPLWNAHLRCAIGHQRISFCTRPTANL